MKLYYYGLAAVASLMMLPGCSHEELLAESAENAGNTGNEVLVFIPGNSEFEISLSSGNGTSASVSKRAAVNQIADMDQIGVFCLARGKQALNQAAQDIEWFNDQDENLKTCTLMKNVLATPDEDDNLSWEDHYFYPNSHFYAYGLYGYYPYVSDEYVTCADNKVIVRHTIDGTMDLICGRASAHDDDASAYSANFFRQSETLLGYVPVLEMKHLLTRLEFYVQPGETYEGSGVVFEGAENMVVDEISILHASCEVNTLVADLTAPNEDASVSAAGDAQADFTLKGTNGEALTSVPVGTVLGVETRIGESIMLVPDSEYLLRIILKDVTTGKQFPTETPLILSSTDTDNIFQAGMSYKVIIIANKPKEVQLKANVGEWPEAENNPPSIIL